MDIAQAGVAGTLPSFAGAGEPLTQALNETADRLLQDALSFAEANKTAQTRFSFETIESPPYISVLIYMDREQGETSGQTVTTIVLKEEEETYRLAVLPDLLGPNAFALARQALAAERENTDAPVTALSIDKQGEFSDRFYIDRQGDVAILDANAAEPALTISPADVLNKELALSETISQNGVKMVPLRAVAEALGFSVGWNGAEKSLSLSAGPETVTMAIGERMYEGKALEAPLALFGQTAYVPVGFFETVAGAVYTETADGLAFSKIRHF